MDSRRRRQNFTDDELRILFEGARKRRDTVLGRVNSSNTKEMKHKCWKAIADEVNTISEAHREPEDVRKKFYDFRCYVKKKALQAKIDSEASGGDFYNSAHLTAIEVDFLTFVNDVSFVGLDIPESETILPPLKGMKIKKALKQDGQGDSDGDFEVYCDGDEGNMNGNDDFESDGEGGDAQDDGEHNGSSEKRSENVRRSTRAKRSIGSNSQDRYYNDEDFLARRSLKSRFKRLKRENSRVVPSLRGFGRNLGSGQSGSSALDGVFTKLLAKKAAEEENADLLFLKGLLPDMKQLSDRNKRTFKTNVMSDMNKLLDQQDQVEHNSESNNRHDNKNLRENLILHINRVLDQQEKINDEPDTQDVALQSLGYERSSEVKKILDAHSDRLRKSLISNINSLLDHHETVSELGRESSDIPNEQMTNSNGVGDNCSNVLCL